MSRETFDDRVEALFRRHPGEWIDSTRLEAIGGRCGWRTRVSTVRRTRGLTIENRTRRVPRPDGSHYVASEYRYVPSDLFALAQL